MFHVSVVTPIAIAGVAARAYWKTLRHCRIVSCSSAALGSALVGRFSHPLDSSSDFQVIAFSSFLSDQDFLVALTSKFWMGSTFRQRRRSGVFVGG